MDPADKSSIEIKALMRRLHPKAGNHKDRIRRLGKFRNYVRGDGKNTPDFYDDDIPLLLLGSASPSALLDEENVVSDVYGLLEACGCLSSQHDNMLKRSARHCMNLLKYLVIDHKEIKDGQSALMGMEDVAPGSYAEISANPFALAFCSLPVHYYKLMRLELHLVGDARGGAKNDACALIVLLLTMHLTEDGENPSPLRVEDLLPMYKAQQAFDKWTTDSDISRDILEKIKKNQSARENEIQLRQRQDQLANKTLGRISEEYELDEQEDNSEGIDQTEGLDDDLAGSDGDDDFDDGAGGVLAGFQRRKKERQKELKLAAKAGEISTKTSGPALRWEDSQLYREQKARAASASRAQAAGQVHETLRDSQQAMQEMAEKEEEKAKILGKDPLGIRNESTFDLRAIQNRQAEIMEHALQALDEGIHGDDANNDERSALHLNTTSAGVIQNLQEEDEFKKRQAQKESLMAIVDRLGGMDQLENPSRSVLVTEPNFDPMLFLSLVHMDVGYKQLIGSIDRLTNKVENQIVQLQNLVRDNFPLFVRCAEGIEAFNNQTATEVGPGVNERIDALEELAEIAAEKAKKSFKPLLDNASEVRKVQSALAVLQRVAPILQAPFLMRQHVENRRYSQALKAYRRVLVIDENCTIELLNHVKYQAAKYLHETRKDLEQSLAEGKAPIPDLLNNISDLSELLELDVPMISYPGDPNSAGGIGVASKDSDDSSDNSGNDNDDNKTAKNNNNINKTTEGVFIIGTERINIRKHPPALACLLIQAAHFSNDVYKCIESVDNATQKILSGEKGIANVGSMNGSKMNSSGISDSSNDSSSDGFNDGSNNNNAMNMRGRGLAQASNMLGGELSHRGALNGNDGDKDKDTPAPTVTSTTQWKYDVLDARVMATRSAVDIARNWLPRLLRIGKAAREDEKRKAARVYGRNKSSAMYNNHTTATNTGVGAAGGANGGTNAAGGGKKTVNIASNETTAFDVFTNEITPTVRRLVEHAAFCGLGCPSRGNGGSPLVMTFGENAPEKLRALLRSPLPPSQSTRVDTQLAELVEILGTSSIEVNGLRSDIVQNNMAGVGNNGLMSGGGSIIPGGAPQSNDPNSAYYQVSPLDESKSFCESAVITIEKRRCIYAFEVCARICSSRAAGSGKFDADALLNCLQILSDKLTRPEECTTEVESGCELVVRRCCEGLASYVRDRGDSARLSAVSECADVMENTISEIVREAIYLTNNVENIEEVLMEDIMGLEGAMFDEYLESIKDNVARTVKVGFLDMEYDSVNNPNKKVNNNTVDLAGLNSGLNNNDNYYGGGVITTFPPYLSASLLAIVRCRAQVEQALGGKVRKADNITYQHLSMATVADAVVENICTAVNVRRNNLKVRQADRLANELQFLLNTLRKFLSKQMINMLESTRYMLYTIAGRTDDSSAMGGGGPDGLAALEDLERLGRVYVLCLGEL